MFFVCLAVFCAGVWGLVKEDKKAPSAVAVSLAVFYICASFVAGYFMCGAFGNYNRVTQRYDALMAKAEAGDAEASRTLGEEWGLGMSWFAGHIVKIPEDTDNPGDRELLKISKKYAAFVLSQAENGNADFSDAAFEAYNVTKDVRYLSAVEKIAENGGINAARLLCMHYQGEIPSIENRERLHYWAQKLAESDDLELGRLGYCIMGDLYADGVNFPGDAAKSVALYKRGGMSDDAVKGRIKSARIAAAEWYFLGEYGLPKDEAKGVEFLRKSGMTDDEIAQRAEFYRGLSCGGAPQK